jgi:anti-sigma28 factor (negative regulator of flagellin synthesis)
MRVHDRNLTGASPAESGRAQEAQKLDRNQGARTENVAKGDGDRVDLSSTLERLSRAMSAGESERASRIEALAAQYRSGGYQPDSAATAGAYIKNFGD